MNQRFLFLGAIVFILTSGFSGENRFRMKYSEGPVFYTAGDYKAWSKSQNISWIGGADYGVEFNRHRFESNHNGGKNYMIFKIDDTGYDLSLTKAWKFGRYFRLGTSAGMTYLSGKSEETILNFWAAPSEYPYLELKLYRFNTANYDSTELGRQGYRFYAFPPDVNGVGHVTVTEIRDRTYYGFTSTLSTSFHYKNLALSVQPGFNWYPETIIYRIAFGLGVEVNI